MTELIKEDWTLDELYEQAEDLRKRLNLFRTSLGQFLVEKQELIDLMVIAAVAQEPLLLIGPPGTAKSDLVLKFRDAIGIADELVRYSVGVEDAEDLIADLESALEQI